jgi:hypothetical protein
MDFLITALGCSTAEMERRFAAYPSHFLAVAEAFQQFLFAIPADAVTQKNFIPN